MTLRKTITIFVLCLAALLPICLSGLFITGRILIRISVMEKMETENLQTIRIPTREIKWYKKNHELTIDGNMFDVKSIRESGDTSIITGLFDEEDTELHEALAGLHEQKNKGHNNALMIFQVCLGIIAIQNPILDNLPIPNFIRSVQAFAPYSDGVSETWLTMFSPPPEYVC